MFDMSQNTRATVASPPDMAGRIWNVFGSGYAITSPSWMRLKPWIEEPSDAFIPSSIAFSSSAGGIKNVFGVPSTSVNQSWMKRTPRSSTVFRTYSRWFSIGSPSAAFPGRDRPSRTDKFRRPHEPDQTPGVTAAPHGPWRSHRYDGDVGWLTVALCQIDAVVGDFEGNIGRILGALATAEGSGADVAVFPELVVTGYSPEDLLLEPDFVAASEAALTVWAHVGRCAAVVGCVADSGGLGFGRGLRRRTCGASR